MFPEPWVLEVADLGCSEGCERAAEGMAGDHQAKVSVILVSFRHHIAIAWGYCNILVQESLVDKAVITESRRSLDYFKIMHPIFNVACTSESKDNEFAGVVDG